MYRKKMTERACDMRWLKDRGLPRIITPIFDPFSYKENILNMIEGCNPSTLIEFIDAGNKIAFTCTVKSLQQMLTQVNKALDKLDQTTLSAEEVKKLMMARPWDFWKSKEMQELVMSIMDRKNGR